MMDNPLLQAGGDVRTDWRTINALELARREHARLLGIDGTGPARVGQRLWQMHPFKLYQVALGLRTTTPDPDVDWRTFRVRGGSVLGVAATGTDGADAAPDGELFPVVDDIVVPVPGEGETLFWFWLEAGASPEAAWSVQHGFKPEEAGWGSFPVPDATHVPIGSVDVTTRAADKLALVRQYLRADVVTVGTSQILRGTFVSMGGDFNVLRPLGAAGDGTEDIRAAKPYKIRFSIASASIDGVTYSYTYAGDATTTQRRVASAAGQTEAQVIVPRFLPGDELLYTPMVTGVEFEGADVGYRQLDGPHAWAKYVPPA